ncbi:MAG TPA: response regulator transcription factor [Bacteroidales bacterium]|nr:response regulator transcription factor [Bacteroidales bacterium]HPT03266.1 response regulator transcription factor [Bacteroidales bacterium]
MEPKARILLVEDDVNLSDVLTDFLEMTGYSVVLAADGQQGLAEYGKGKFDLLILDVMLPVMDGFSLAAAIRKADGKVPIIFLTARGQMEDRIAGFKAGCDDYITKPFSSEELSLRIDAILRRCRLEAISNDENYKLGSFIFDPANFELKRANKRINLTPKEAALLKVLCEHKNSLLTREKALKVVWGDDDYFIGRSMDVFITKLRKLLREDPDVAIVNVHGAGFRLEVKEG